MKNIGVLAKELLGIASRLFSRLRQLINYPRRAEPTKPTEDPSVSSVGPPINHQPVPVDRQPLVIFRQMKQAAAADDVTELGDPWTIGSLLENVEVYQRQASYATTALYGHASFLNKSDWNAYKRITVHAMRDNQGCHIDRYDYVKQAGFPAFGGLLFGTDENKIDPSLCGIHAIFFCRFDRLPWHVRSDHPGIPYEVVTVYVADKQKTPLSFFVVIDRDSGEMHSCEFLQLTPKTIQLPPSRRKHQRHSFSIVDRKWRTYESFSNDHAGASDRHSPGTYAKFAAYPLNAYAQRLFNPLVIVSNSYRRMSFSVDLGYAPKFFRDRGFTVVKKGGRRAPILHWVKAHQKQYDDKVVNTRVHLRGERRFTWRGHQVSIVIPGLHTPMNIFAASTHRGSHEADPPKGVGVGGRRRAVEPHHLRRTRSRTNVGRNQRRSNRELARRRFGRGVRGAQQ